ncbi:MAG TPA: PEP-CTERM sorting domain-containing protein [Candidatus Baltobacteraceae bacterium]|jgi:hypothetical protein|nr:PEP-CTERM sorting domain-containing protein [Candidatus Baltobacteraceae bacterium]
MKKIVLTPISIPRLFVGARYGIFALGMWCGIGQIELCHAQGTLNVDATISAVQDGGVYDYTIELNNPSGSPAVGTFWYAWVPGQFYLGTEPSSVTSPSGWSDSVVANHSIEFNTSTAPLAPGTSATFGFTSTEAPATLYASSADISFVYTGSTAFSGSGEQFTVSPIPEPSSIALMMTGLTGAWFARRKR